MKKRADATPVNGSAEVQPTKNSGHSVTVYVIALVIVVICCILLSFFISKRNEKVVDTITEKMTQAEHNIEIMQEKNVELTAENETLKAEKEELQSQIDTLTTEKEKLEEDIDQLKLDWQKDTKELTDQFKAEYNELLIKYTDLTQQNKENNQN